MGVTKVRRRLAVAGEVSIGANADATLERGAANFLRMKSGDYFGVNAGTVAVGTVNLGVANTGAMQVGFNGATAQVGVIINGTCFVLEGTAGGAVTLVADPAGA